MVSQRIHKKNWKGFIYLTIMTFSYLSLSLCFCLSVCLSFHSLSLFPHWFIQEQEIFSELFLSLSLSPLSCWYQAGDMTWAILSMRLSIPVPRWCNVRVLMMTDEVWIDWSDPAALHKDSMKTNLTPRRSARVYRAGIIIAGRRAQQAESVQEFTQWI